MTWGTRKLADGYSIPEIAFGTWTAGHGSEVVEQVHQALDVGFDHIDTAQVYGNEEEVGQAIKKQRPDLYITTKWSGRKSMNESLHDSLNWLGVDAVDLYLIHAPRVAGDDVAETWRDFLKLKADGFTKSAGVSNFGIEHLKQIKHAGLEMPVANQILLHPYVPFEKTKALLDYHNKHNIVTEAYSTLWPLTHNPEGQVTQVLDKIAEKHQVQPDQVLFSWARAKGAVVVTTSRRRERLEGYLDAGDLFLSRKETTSIDRAGGAPNEYDYHRAEIFAPITLAVIGLILALAWFWRRQRSSRLPLSGGLRPAGYDTIPQGEDASRNA